MLFSTLGGLLSSPPTVPEAPNVNLAGQQGRAIAANERALPAIQNLASGVNSFNQEQLQRMLEGAIPMYNSLVSGASGNIDSMLKGELPQDVRDQIQNSAAGRSLAGGYAGTGMSNALTARDLGLNSLDLINRGISSAQSWLGTMRAVATPQQFDVTSMFVSPQQMAANAWQNQTGQFQRNWMNNQIQNAYQPNNVAGNAMIGFDSMISSLAGSAAGSYLGGVVGGAGSNDLTGKQAPPAQSGGGGGGL